MRIVHAPISSLLTASLLSACILFGCASAELPQASSDARLSDDGGERGDVGIEDVTPDADGSRDVRPVQDPGADTSGDAPACVPAVCEELLACGTADDGCGSSLDCGTCPEVDQVTLSPSGNQTLQVAEELALSAVATTSDGAETFCEFQWTSQDPTVARVDSSGKVTGLVSGITNIKVECRGTSTRLRLYINDSGLPATLTNPDELAIWLRADVGLNYSGGAQVERWEDLSGHGFAVANGIFSRHPRRINSAINGEPVVRFTGAHELRAVSDFVALSEATVFTIAKNNEASHVGQIVSNCSDGGNNQFRFEGTERQVFFFGEQNGLNETVALDAPTTTEHLLSVVLSDSALGVFLNGQPQASVATSTNGTWNFGQVGARCSSEYLRGDIAEIMIYKTALSDAQRQQVEAYLMSRYGL
jgi:hypothetical protein